MWSANVTGLMMTVRIERFLWTSSNWGFLYLAAVVMPIVRKLFCGSFVCVSVQKAALTYGWPQSDCAHIQWHILIHSLFLWLLLLTFKRPRCLMPITSSDTLYLSISVSWYIMCIFSNKENGSKYRESIQHRVRSVRASDPAAVWLVTSSVSCRHTPLPILLIVLSTASVGPDNRIRPAPNSLAGWTNNS